mmetsp:Transcript_24156/g.37268  ORF Transcript_24156/g.37268 Transcript_24156/m.37268 type:complete len:292 (+) Transcript_24156:170-1045(+)
MNRLIDSLVLLFHGCSCFLLLFLSSLVHNIGKIERQSATSKAEIPSSIHDLFVNTLRICSHDDTFSLRVDLCIEKCVSDEVDNPTLGLVLVHGQFFSQRAKVNLVMYSTVILKDKDPRFFHKKSSLFAQEKVCTQYLLAIRQFRLSRLKIKLDAETIHKLNNWVGIIAVLHNLDEIFHQTASFTTARTRTCVFCDPSLAEKDGSSQVSQEMRSVCCNSLQVAFGMKEFHHTLETSFVVPKDEKGPMQQPGSLFQCLKGGELTRGDERLDCCLYSNQCLAGIFPVFNEDFTS